MIAVPSFVTGASQSLSPCKLPRPILLKPCSEQLNSNLERTGATGCCLLLTGCRFDVVIANSLEAAPLVAM